jgi:hypothetical protein
MPEVVEITAVSDDSPPPPATLSPSPSPPPPPPTLKTRKDGFPVGSRPVPTETQSSLIAKTIPNPRYTRYLSDHSNKEQRTDRLLEWWRSLPSTAQSQMSAHVYRDFPPLIDPPDGEFKYIDVIIEPPDSDKAFNDMYGAGDYHFYLNTGGEKGSKRTLAEGYIKGHRDFKSQPPSDKRITELDSNGIPKFVDFHDPVNRTYVEFLRSRGIIPEIFQQKKKEDEMAAEGVIKQVLEQNAKMMDKMSSQPASAPATGVGYVDPSVSAALAELRGSITGLRETISAGKNSPDMMQMLTFATNLADRASKGNDPDKYLGMIMDLNKDLAQAKLEGLRSEINALRAERGGGGNPSDPASNYRSGAGLTGWMEELRSVKKFVDDVSGVGEGGGVAEVAKAPWWGELVGIAMPHLATMTGNLVQLYQLSKMTQPQASTPMPMPQPMPMSQAPPSHPSPMPAQGAIPSPSPTDNPNPQPSASAPPPPPPPADVLGNHLNMIQIPLLNCLEDGGQTGADFAYWFENGFGEPLFRNIVEYGPKNLSIPTTNAQVMALDNFAPLKAQLSARGITREKVEVFVREFVGYKREEYERVNGMDGAGDGEGDAA